MGSSRLAAGHSFFALRPRFHHPSIYALLTKWTFFILPTPLLPYRWFEAGPGLFFLVPGAGTDDPTSRLFGLFSRDGQLFYCKASRIFGSNLATTTLTPSSFSSTAKPDPTLWIPSIWDIWWLEAFRNTLRLAGWRLHDTDVDRVRDSNTSDEIVKDV